MLTPSLLNPSANPAFTASKIPVYCRVTGIKGKYRIFEQKTGNSFGVSDLFRIFADGSGRNPD